MNRRLALVYAVSGLFLMACAALSRLLPAGEGPTKEAPGRDGFATGAVDADGDGFGNAADNCPLTANPGQEDGDRNRLGDSCDSPSAGGFASAGDDGVTQLVTDERLRPIQIVAPSIHITLAWSDDASRVEVTIDDGDSQASFALEVDLSDEALLAALEAGEDATGEDLGSLREWIAQNPGLIQAVARGEVPPPTLLPEPISDRSGGPGLFTVRPMANAQADIEDYLYVLADTAIRAEYIWDTFSEAHPELEPGLATARNALLDLSIAATRKFEEQEAACHPCSAACLIPCSQDTGACFTDPARFANPSDPGPCSMTTAQACTEGVHFPDQRCPSACWFTNPELASLPAGERCTMTDYFTCWEMPQRANQQERGGEGLNVTTLFCRAQTCGDPMCTP